MIKLSQGFRCKLEDCIDLNSPFKVTMKTNGNAVYDNCCFGVDNNNKLSDDRYMVFYNQPKAPDDAIILENESYIINISKLPKEVGKLVFTVSIDGNEVMSQINSHVVSISQNGNDLMELQLGGDSFHSEKAIISIEIYFKTVWRIGAVANGFNGGLADLLKYYGGELADDSAKNTTQPEKSAPAPNADKNAETPKKKSESNRVCVSYDDEKLTAGITVNGADFDTSRINGREIDDWAYPFMMRNIHWNGFYEEMTAALNGEKEFELVFEGSAKALAVLKEALEAVPVTITAQAQQPEVVIEYDENELAAEISINGEIFDTSRINGKDIEDWVYPFMMRNIKWDGIYQEISAAAGTEKYKLTFVGSEKCFAALKGCCPESVSITFNEKQAKKAAQAEKAPEARKNDTTDVSPANDDSKNIPEVSLEEAMNDDGGIEIELNDPVDVTYYPEDNKYFYYTFNNSYVEPFGNNAPKNFIFSLFFYIAPDSSSAIINILQRVNRAASECNLDCLGYDNSIDCFNDLLDYYNYDYSEETEPQRFENAKTIANMIFKKGKLIEFFNMAYHDIDEYMMNFNQEKFEESVALLTPLNERFALLINELQQGFAENQNKLFTYFKLAEVNNAMIKVLHFELDYLENEWNRNYAEAENASKTDKKAIVAGGLAFGFIGVAAGTVYAKKKANDNAAQKLVECISKYTQGFKNVIEMSAIILAINDIADMALNWLTDNYTDDLYESI